MIITNIDLINYRKFDHINIDLVKGINLIEGLNGSGKTTIIESIGVALYGESFSNTSLNNVIKMNTDNCTIKLNIKNLNMYEIVRNINMINNNVNQSLYLNNKSLSPQQLTSDIKLINKKTFFDFCIIKYYDNILENINTISFQENISTMFITWDIKNILTSIKESIKTYNNMKNKYRSNINSYQKENIYIDDLNTNLKESIAAQEKIMKEILQIEDKILILNLEKQKYLTNQNIGINDLENIINIFENFKVSVIDLKEKYKINYIEENLILCDKILNNINILEVNINKLYENSKKNYSSKYLDMVYSENKILKDMEIQIKEKNENEYKLMNINKDINNYYKKIEKYNKNKHELEFLKHELNAISRTTTILNNVHIIINQTWEQIINDLKMNIIDKINLYLTKINLNYSLLLDNNIIKIQSEKSILEINNISAGQIEILNIITKICILEEIKYKDVIIIEDPTSRLDRLGTEKFNILLTLINSKFEQIIITTHSQDNITGISNKISLPYY